MYIITITINQNLLLVMIEDFAQKLKKLLEQELPGDLSHQKMMSYKRPSVPEVLQKDNYRESAVLILFYPHDNEIHLAFMLRPTYDGVHSGQICFPGGRREQYDENLVSTALREAEEELNVKKEEVQILGNLSRIYVPPSNFLIQPVVAYSKHRPMFVPDEKEVEALIEVPLKILQDSSNIQKTKINIQNNVELEVAGFVYRDQLIWGATSMILMELMDVLEEMPSKSF